MIKKAVNGDYINPKRVDSPRINEHNRAYIDRFVSLNYKSLRDKFRKLSGTVNSSAFDSLDVLDEMILKLYTDSELKFDDWEQANSYLSSKFMDKAIRIIRKKPTKEVECEDSEEELIQI